MQAVLSALQANVMSLANATLEKAKAELALDSETDWCSPVPIAKTSPWANVNVVRTIVMEDQELSEAMAGLQGVLQEQRQAITKMILEACENQDVNLRSVFVTCLRVSLRETMPS